jgi:RNA polymerase I-specific transcription initiation factor RRN7
MRDKLPSYYHATLDPNSLLKYERFYSATVELEIALEKEYGIVWPKLNHALLLFRYLKDLALPLELYDATIRLLGYLDYDLTLPKSDNVKISVRQIPETQLAACLVVCIKLMYPFDGPKRYPKTASEPASAVIDWGKWQEHISSHKANPGRTIKVYTPEDLYSIEEKDVFSMSDNQVDQFLDWYASSFIEESVFAPQNEYQRALYDMFPIDPLPNSTALPPSLPSPAYQERLDTVRAVHSSFKPRRVISGENEEEDTARPGNAYRYWRKVEHLPETAKKFYEELGKVAGLSVDMLVLAVFFAEKGVQRWMKKQKRQARENSSNNQ